MLAEPRDPDEEARLQELLAPSASARLQGGSSSSSTGDEAGGRQRISNVEEWREMHRQRTSAGDETKTALQQARQQALLNREKARRIEERSARMEKNAENFASLARKLREQEERSSNWFGLL